MSTRQKKVSPSFLKMRKNSENGTARKPRKVWQLKTTASLSVFIQCSIFPAVTRKRDVVLVSEGYE